MNLNRRRLVAAGLALAALVACALAPPAGASPLSPLPPFAYWDCDLATPPAGWAIPGSATWMERFPTDGTPHEQTRYVDADGSGTVSRGDHIEVPGPGTTVWFVVGVTTELLIDPAIEGLSALDVATDKYFFGCGGGYPEPGETCGPRYPAEGDTFYVISPDFNQVLIYEGFFMLGCFRTHHICAGDLYVLSGAGIPPPTLEQPWTHVVRGWKCGVWLSRDEPTGTARTSWGAMKRRYHR